jgi:hypothetical protein
MPDEAPSTFVRRVIIRSLDFEFAGQQRKVGYDLGLAYKERRKAENILAIPVRSDTHSARYHLMVEWLLPVVTEWDFTDRQTGEPVKVSRESFDGQSLRLPIELLAEISSDLKRLGKDRIKKALRSSPVDRI